MTSERPTILFVCIHNAGRSQMAAAFARALGGELVEVLSAGSEPASMVNPQAVAVMAEAGIDLAGEMPKLLSDSAVERADAVVTMGCGDACAFYAGKRYLDWPLDDPATLDLDGVRRVRDEIRELVSGLLGELGVRAAERG